MNGQQLYNQLTQILGGEQIDETYALALFNLARYDYESRRLWRCLIAIDKSKTALTGMNYTTAYALNSPAVPSQTLPYFMQYLLEGGIVVQNSTNANQSVLLREIAPEYQLRSQGTNSFWVDYVNRVFYILADLSFGGPINQYFIADYGDITLTTSWVGFPPRYSQMLVFQAAARYRMGTDYDDIAARNGDDNFKAAEAMYQAAVKWDANLALNAYQHRDFSAFIGGNGGAGDGYSSGRFVPPNNGGAYGSDFGW